jgi:hypothetical protein
MNKRTTTARTPLELLSRNHIAVGLSRQPIRKPLPEKTTVEVKGAALSPAEQSVSGFIEPRYGKSHSKDGSPIPDGVDNKPAPFPDVPSFAHAAAMGAAMDPHQRKFWQSKGWDGEGPTSVMERLLAQREIDGGEIWGRLGVLKFLDKSPGAWLQGDVIVFLLGIYQRLSGHLPSVHVVLGLLEVIADNDISPAEMIESLGKEHSATVERINELLGFYPRVASFRRWPWQTAKENGAVFDRTRIFQAMLILQMARHMARTDWGLAPFTWLYNGTMALNRHFAIKSE